MTDQNPPATPPAANQPTPPPAYAPPTAPAYGAAPAAPAAYSDKGYGAPAGGDKYNVLAIISLVSAFFVSLAAIICGHIALNQIKKTGEKGRGLAIAGLVLGYLGLITGIIVFAFLIIAWMAALNSGSMTGTY
ncbi:DUF4190 domain-containing protein [Cryobacterium sp. 1639]|uniref:DUF4190 domain-containing protein n=1 Tax=Cryobacterium inferilacus TaxID=2866629 RepID=UPI001C738FEB|nr:DUF4190 domain-containing protein [Cryobacterium sp. 1639]MBX0301037.1 DUF4190 domain-containing protein [Cryobacterium sp. 1639]